MRLQYFADHGDHVLNIRPFESLSCQQQHRRLGSRRRLSMTEKATGNVENRELII